jgi:hypothetical protein
MWLLTCTRRMRASDFVNAMLRQFKAFAEKTGAHVKHHAHVSGRFCCHALGLGHTVPAGF